MAKPRKLKKKDKALTELLNMPGLTAVGGNEHDIEAMSPAGEFGKNGMELLYLNYEHPIYCQLGREFIPYIGIFDLLFNEGFDVALDIIRSGIRKNYSSLEIRRMAD